MASAIVSGIIGGTIPGLLAVGLVLIFKGSRIFNFAQAEFGTVAAFAGYVFITHFGMPYALGALLAIGVAAVVGLITELVIVRPLFDAPRVTLLVATAGWTLFLGQMQFLIFGTGSHRLAAAIPGQGVGVLGFIVSPQQGLIFVTLVAVAVVLYLFFARADLGVAVLATSQEATAAELVGISSRRMSSLVWVMAAVLGGMNSLPGAFLGGQVIGISSSLAEYFNVTAFDSAIPGVSNFVLFLLVLVVLLVRPQGLLGTAESTRV